MQLVQEAAAATATAVALDSAMKALHEEDLGMGDPKAQVADNLAGDTERTAGLVQHHMGLHLQQRMAHRKGLLSHGHCVTAAHSLDRVHRIGHSVQWLLLWLAAVHEVVVGRDEEASVQQKDYQPCCHQPRVRRRVMVGERPVVQQVL